MTTDRTAFRTVDPQAVRVAIAHRGDLLAEAMVLEPAQDGLDGTIVADGEAAKVHLERHDAVHATLIEDHGGETVRSRVLLLPSHAGGSLASARVREVVVDGWRVEVAVESERRASLRDRARRAHEAAVQGGPTEVRAIIPGRVIAVTIVPGDAVTTGDQLLVVEAMKMQNELRAPRDGVVSRLAVAAGKTVEVGDLLLVLE